MADGEQPRAGGWNRIHFIVDDLDREIAALAAAGVSFRNDVVEDPVAPRSLPATRPAT